MTSAMTGSDVQRDGDASGRGRRRLGLALAGAVFLGGAGIGGVIIARVSGGRSGAGGGSSVRAEGTVRSAVVSPAVMGAPGAQGGAEGGVEGGAEGASASPSTILEAARKLIKEQRFDPARSILERGVEVHPADQSLRLALAQAWLGLKEPGKALEQYRSAIELGGKSVPASLHFEAGTVASAAGLTDEAEEHFGAAQMADPRDPKIPLYLAMVQLKRNEEDAAAASLVRAVALDPNLAEGWGTLGELHLKQGKTDLALQSIEKARRLSPTVSRWVLAEARARKRNGDGATAIKLLTGLNEPDASSLPVLRTLAECHGMLGEKDKAAAVLTAAADKKRSDAELQFEASVWLARSGDAARAREYAQRAAERGWEPAKKMLAEESER
jgi:tetratricopeptide (TPR) repeat protein